MVFGSDARLLRCRRDALGWASCSGFLQLLEEAPESSCPGTSKDARGFCAYGQHELVNHGLGFIVWGARSKVSGFETLHRQILLIPWKPGPCPTLPQEACRAGTVALPSLRVLHRPLATTSCPLRTARDEDMCATFDALLDRWWHCFVTAFSSFFLCWIRSGLLLYLPSFLHLCLRAVPLQRQSPCLNGLSGLHVQVSGELPSVWLLALRLVSFDRPLRCPPTTRCVLWELMLLACRLRIMLAPRQKGMKALLPLMYLETALGLLLARMMSRLRVVFFDFSPRLLGLLSGRGLMRGYLMSIRLVARISLMQSSLVVLLRCILSQGLTLWPLWRPPLGHQCHACARVD